MFIYIVIFMLDQAQRKYASDLYVATVVSFLKYRLDLSIKQCFFRL